LQWPIPFYGFNQGREGGSPNSIRTNFPFPYLLPVEKWSMLMNVMNVMMRVTSTLDTILSSSLVDGRDPEREKRRKLKP
jgi:hypothetical protein